MSRRWAGRALSVAAGAPLALAFPEPGLWPLAYAGLVPLLLLVRAAGSAREGAVRAWLGAAAMLTATQLWLLPVTGPFLPLLTLAVGALWLPWGAAAWALLRGRPGPGRVALSALLLGAGWVAIEYVRSWDRLGGPFGLLGSSQWRNPPMLALAAVGGVWAVSFAAVAVNVALTALVAGGRGRAAARVAALAVAAVALGLGPAARALVPAPEAGPVLRVGLVQPGIVRDPGARFAAGERATRELAGRRLDLIVWGESSVGFDLGTRPDLLARLVALTRETGADLLVNVDARRPDLPGIYKSSVLVTPDGVAGRYDKLRLVPFGEYIPLRPLFGWVGRFTDAATEDRRRGRRLTTMTVKGHVIGPLVCFESAFPDLARHLAADGAELIVVQSATTTFQRSWAPEQHASLAAVRAVETGRPVVHATVSGVTTVADASGRILTRVPTSERGSRTVDVHLVPAGRTPYVRYGDWLPLGSLLVSALALLVAVLRRRPLAAGAPVSLGAARAGSSAAPGRARPGGPARR